MAIKNKSFRFIIYILVLFFCALVQNSEFLNKLRLASAKPNLILIIVVYFGLKIDDELAYITGFIGGLFLDIFSIGLIGMNSFIQTLIAYFATLFKTKIYSENTLSISLFMLLFSLINSITTFLLKIIFTGELQTIKTIFTESIYNAVLTPFIFFLLNKLFISITGREN